MTISLWSKSLVFSLYILFDSFGLSHCYCWQPGWNPHLTAPPSVTQINVTIVQVSWKNIVRNAECADQFLVKYWKLGKSSNYKQSDLVATNVDAVMLTGIAPKMEYVYQVIAREDKLMGIDYNRSPTQKYTTSHNRDPQNHSFGENNLNVVSVDTHKANEKYNPKARVVKNVPGKGLISNNFINVDNAKQEVFGKEENSVDIIMLLAITAGAVIGAIIVVGVLYNCIKRRHQGRHLNSRSQKEESLSCDEEDQSQDEDT